MLVNPYLLRLTDKQRNFRWFWQLLWGSWRLWAGSCVLIWIADSSIQFADASRDLGTILRLSLVVLTTAGLLAGFLFTGTQLVQQEVKNERLTDVRLTNLSQKVIVWSLVIGAVYRARHWLVWLIGGCPFLIYVVSRWCISDSYYCYITILNHIYCPSIGAPAPARVLEIIWFLSLTVGLICIGYLCIQSSIELSLKINNAAIASIGVLVVAIPLLLGIIILVAPEGYAFAHTIFMNATSFRYIPSDIAQILSASLIVAGLPFVALLVGVQRTTQP